MPVITWDFSFFGSTSFRSSILKRSNFSCTDLFGADFSGAHIKDTSFLDARRFLWTNFRHTVLEDLFVLNLAITGCGANRDYSGKDLSYLYLAGADLSHADLSNTFLVGTNLSNASLFRANLAKAQVTEADMSGASLTGACLEAWNIDSTTTLKDIDCQYVYLLEQSDAKGSRERRPHDPDKIFQPGDFEKFFKDMLDTVQSLIRNGINPDAFKAALHSLMETYPDISADSIQGFERKGDDVLVTLQVPEGTDKGDLERTWDEVYEARLEAAATHAQLEAAQQRAEDAKEIALAYGSFLSN